MPAYRINIDGRIYEGHWNSKTNAVFGAMRKDENDRYAENNQLSPFTRHREHTDGCTFHQAYRCTCHVGQEWRDACLVSRLLDDLPSHISVVRILDRKVAKRVHRVNENPHESSFAVV